MREDIAKKLCERPRFGGDKYQLRSDRRKYKNHRNFDSLPKKESIRAVNIRRYNGKYRNAFFSPLRGFLRKNVNRPWNKVFSEICKHLNPSSTTQKNVFDHLIGGFVVVKPMFLEGSNIPYKPGWVSLTEISSGYYVDKHGILKAADTPKARKRWEKERKVRYSDYRGPRKLINGLEEYRRIKGIWYHVWYKNMYVGESAYDVVLRQDIIVGPHTYHSMNTEHGKAVTFTGQLLDWQRCRLAIDKKQVSKKEIRTEKLNKI